MPTPSAKPDSEIMFSVMLLKYMSTTANSTLSGMLNAMITVGRMSRKKTISTSTASRPPYIRLDSTLLTIR